MFIKVKRFQHLESLLLESQGIEMTNRFDAALTDFTKNASAPDYTKFDALIDSILDEQISNQQAFINKFGDNTAANLINSYLGYCDTRLKAVTSKIIKEYGSNNPVLEEIKNNQEALVVIHSRINKLTKIYEDLSTRIQNSQILPIITQKIQEVTQTVNEAWSEVMNGIGSIVRTTQNNMANAATEEEKTRFAKLTLIKFKTLISLGEPMPTEWKQAISMGKAAADSKIKDAGLDPDQLTQSYSRTDDITKRIVRLEITNWKTEDLLDYECDQIKAQINALTGTPAEPKIEAYRSELNDIVSMIKQKLSDKSLDLDKTKGIHFDFNIKLRLYEKTPLPVTGQQIADNSKIMKFRKGLASFISFFASDSSEPLTPAGQAFANLGKSIHDTYAKVLNTSAMFIGKALGGKEGKLKADAISRMFIPDTKVLDKKPVVAEELGAGSAPGLSIQVPGSIGSMGPITPPTATSFGSGDNFSPKKKKSKSKILGFSEYLKENKF